MSRIQAPLDSVVATIHLRARGATTANNSGVRSERQRPSTHGSNQKRIELPLPTSQRMEVLKNTLVTSSSWSGRATHVRELLVRLNHSQRSRSALPMRFKKRTPRPPRVTDLVTLLHATMHLPPCIVSIPDHKNALKIFTNTFCSQGGKCKLMAV
jgi:hypothetical protein